MDESKVKCECQHKYEQLINMPSFLPFYSNFHQHLWPVTYTTISPSLWTLCPACSLILSDFSYQKSQCNNV